MAKKEFVSKYNANKIEELLDRINERPVYPFYDQTDGYWRVFASQENCALWQANPELYSGLVIWEFEGKTPREIVLNNLVDVKYIRLGDTGTTIDFSFYTQESNGDISREAVSVYYTFQNDSNSQTVSSIYAPSTNVSFNVDRYLREGTNTITIFIKGRSTGAMRTVVINYNVIELSLETSFDVSKSKDYASSINVSYRCKGKFQRYVKFYIDGDLAASEPISANSEQSTMIQESIPNPYSSGKHTLQVQATMMVNDNQFKTKVLYYEFCIKGNNISPQVMIAEEIDDIIKNTVPTVEVEQYVPVEINWGYYTSDLVNRSASIEWRLVPQSGGEGTTLSTLKATTLDAVTDVAPDPLRFVPTTVGVFYLQAVILGTTTVVAQYGLDIKENASGIVESTNALRLKLQALGRSNSEDASTLSVWQYNNGQDTISTNFNGVQWNAVSGWDGEALCLSGGATAEVLFEPFKSNNPSNYSPQISGCTVEVEFEVYNVEEDTEVIHIGDTTQNANDNMGEISIKTTTATMTSHLNTSIKTNYKDNERIKLCFIIMPSGVTASDITAEHNLLYIVNNGVHERAKLLPSGDSFVVDNVTGRIKLGASNGKASVKIYSIRCYYTFLSVNAAWNNAVIDDAEHISDRVADNDIYEEGTNKISVDKVSSRIPTMLITGDIDHLISANAKTTRVCDAQWINPFDNEKNFTLKSANFRNHGQSTLGMPVPSIKFWSSKPDGVAQIFDADGNAIISGRYAFNDEVMPMKKWVLQANYMDSTCCHNGSILRLVNESWYNASINGGYILRTPPQKVAAEDYPSLYRKSFPWMIRTTACSMPCVVFWRKDDTSEYSFLGQYVLMEDKKSDYVYGERSIYKIDGDPFAFYTSKTGVGKLWDNSDTCCFEILRNAHSLSLFQNSSNFYGELEEDNEGEGNINTEGSNEGDDVEASVNWEQAFELIYPDPDDFDAGKSDPEYARYAAKLKALMDWVCGTYQTRDDEDDPTSVGGAAAQAAFEEGARDHLDIYKIAAYYIVYLRFGLVDNTVRNAQLKTYGTDKNGAMASGTGLPEVWWLEYWDCDIANGRRNDGFLVFGPKIDRQTTDPDNPSIYAFAGHDCWLWNALEGWSYWMNTIVPQVAQAIYNGGLSYATAIEMMDKEYCDTWCDKLYNESGHFKYVEQYLNNSSNVGFLSYLLGRGETHRHWWLKTNFDFYDAKWCVGDYTSKRIYIRIQTDSDGTEIVDGQSILTYPIVSWYMKTATSNYFGWAMTDANTVKARGLYKTPSDGTFSFTKDKTFGFGVNDPLIIFAPSSFSELDFHEMARYFLGTVLMDDCNDDVMGTHLTKLILGISKQDMATTVTLNGESVPLRNYATSINFSGFGKNAAGKGGLTALQYLDVQGWRNLTTQLDITSCPNLKYLYAQGSGLTVFHPADGTSFEEIELPSTIQSITMNGVTWNSIEFTDPDTLQTQVAPTNLRSVVISNVGSNNCIRNLMTDWAEYVEDMQNPAQFLQSVEVRMDGINWTGVDVDLLLTLVKIPTANRTIRGYIKVNRTLTQEEINILADDEDGFGADVFDRSNPVFIIDAEAGFVLYAPSKIIMGDSYQLNAITFPLTTEASRFSYSITSPSGVHDSIEDGHTIQSINNIRLNCNTGLITTVEDDTETFNITVQGYDSVNQQSASAQIRIEARTYPTQVSIQPTQGNEHTVYSVNNKKYIIMAGYYYFERIFTPSIFNGTHDDAWSFTNTEGVVGKHESTTLERLCLYVQRADGINLEKSIGYTSELGNGGSLSANLPIVIHQPVAAVTQASNAILLGILIDNNKKFLTDYQFMTDIECMAITTLAFLTGDDTLEHFEELQYFTGITSLNLSGCSLLGSLEDRQEFIDGHYVQRVLSTLNASNLNLTNIDLTGTQLKGITLKSNSDLSSISYGAETKAISLIGQTHLTKSGFVMEDNCPMVTDIMLQGCTNATFKDSWSKLWDWYQHKNVADADCSLYADNIAWMDVDPDELIELAQGKQLVVETPILPNTYQEVEYLQSGSTQYILLPTGGLWKPTYMSAKIMQTTSYNGYAMAVGGRIDTSGAKQYYYSLHNTNGAIAIMCGITSTYSNYELNKWYEFITEDGIGSTTINGNQPSIGGSVTQQGLEIPKIALFRCANSSGNAEAYRATFRIAYVEYINNGTHVHLIPCYRKSDNVAGMYDIVSDTFYTNSGTGTFTVGADVIRQEFIDDEDHMGIEDLTLKGTIYLGDNIDWEQLLALQESYGDNVFEYGGDLHIVAQNDVMHVVGDSSIVEGHSSQYTLSYVSTQDVDHVSFNVSGRTGASVTNVGNVATVTTTETGAATSNITLTAYIHYVGGSYNYTNITISVTKATYPTISEVSIEGSALLEFGEVSEFTRDPEEFTGYTGQTRGEWSLSGDITTYASIDSGSATDTYCKVQVINNDYLYAGGTLTYTLYKCPIGGTESVIGTKTVTVFVRSEDIAVLRAENEPLMTAFWSTFGTNGTRTFGGDGSVLSNENYVLKSEAHKFIDGDIPDGTSTTTGFLYNYRSTLKSLDELQWFDSLTIIPAHFAHDCVNVSTVTFPQNLVEIKEWAFGFGSNLNNSMTRTTCINHAIELPSTVITIGTGAFNGQCMIPTFKAVGVTSIGDMGITGFANCTHFYLDSLESFGGAGRLSQALRIQYLYTPSMRSMGGYTFSSYNGNFATNTEKFEWVIGSNTSIEWVGRNYPNVPMKLTLSRDCSNLSSTFLYGGGYERPWNEFGVEEGNTYFSIRNGCLYDIVNDSYIAMPNSIESFSAPSDLVEVPGKFATYCTRLKHVDFGSMQKIDSGAFAYTGITEVVLDGVSLTHVDNYSYSQVGAFKGCASLESVTLRNIPTWSNKYTFSGCTKLSGVLNLSEGITSVGSLAFSGCNKLTSLVMGNATVGDNTFSNCGFTSVQIGALRFTGNNSTDGNSVFNSCNNLTDITINGECSGFGTARLFAYCHNVERVSFGENVHVLNQGLFEYVGCDTSQEGDGFTIISWGGVNQLNGQVFLVCKMNNMTLPTALTKLGNGALQACRFDSIEIPNTVTSFGTNVFAGCRWTTSIYLNWNVAPNITSSFFGTDGSTRNNYYTGYITRGGNELHVPIGSTGYDSGYWLSPLQDTEKCGFSIIYDI